MRHHCQFLFVLFALMGLALRAEAQAGPDAVPQQSVTSESSLTNISQLKVYVNARTVSVKNVRLEGVLTWADASGQSFVLQDESGALRFDFQRAQMPPASRHRARLEGQVALGNGHAVLRQILFIDNDGLHQMREKSAQLYLKPGRYSFRLDYFQGGRDDGLEVFYEGPNLSRQTIPADACLHPEAGTNWSPGLRVDYYEGDWSQLPDFGRLTPIRSEITTNFTLVEPNRGTNFGLRFTGAVEIPAAGQYRFYVASDDGSRLSFDAEPWRLTVLGPAEFPAAQNIIPGQLLTSEQNYRWSEVDGVVRFAGVSDGVCRLDLKAGEEHMQADVLSADKRFLALLPDAHVRIQGACEATRDAPDGGIARYLRVPDFNQVFIERLPLKTWQSYPSNSIASLGQGSQKGRVVHLVGVVRSVEPGKSFMLEDGTGSILVENPSAIATLSGSPLEVLGWLANDSTNRSFKAVAVQPPGEINDGVARVMPIERIRFMSPADLQRGITAKIRGVVTAMQSPFELTVNDGEYGISCWFDDAILPMNPGDYVEVEGTVWPGAFGPDLGHARVKRLGHAFLPQPVKPVWNRLINGSLEQMWVDIEGVVQKIQDRTLTVEMNGGRIQVHLASGSSDALAALQDSIVRIRGTLMPLYNSQRQILGVRLWVNSPLDIEVEEPPRKDTFSVPLKSVAQLSHFDPSAANPFYRVKVQGQILYAGDGEGYLADGSNGLAFLPKAGQKLAAGDYAEVAGFTELGGPIPLLREALVSTNGHGALPAPRAVTLEEMLAGGHDSTRVSVKGVLVNFASNPQGFNLELQVGPRIFMARLAAGDYKLQEIPAGSRIQVTGTCVGHGWRGRGAGFESVELLMNSPADIQILQLPPWWNARRIVALLVVLITVLLLSLTWVYQLRRKVDQRTAQLNQEMRQRKEIELKHAAEQERSRIARDLHDDLGSSLTEISLLASVGLPSVASPENGQPTERFGVIAGKARLLVNSLDVIVWAADPEEDEIQSFVDYLSGFAREFLMASGLACRFKIPIEFPPLTVDGRIRHGLLLAVKETLNNVVRHAGATEVEFGLNVVGNLIEISIKDNGHGFDVATVRRGNGLNNLQERLADLGGKCEIVSHSGTGTTVKIHLPLQSVT